MGHEGGCPFLQMGGGGSGVRNPTSLKTNTRSARRVQWAGVCPPTRRRELWGTPPPMLKNGPCNRIQGGGVECYRTPSRRSTQS